MDREGGNAFFIILLAVALLGAFTATVMNIEKDGGDGSQEQQAIQLGKMVQSFGGIRDAIYKLKMVNECADGEISFVHDSNTDGAYSSADDYWNAAAPISCYLFDPGGAGLGVPAIPKGVNDGTAWAVTANNRIVGVGDESQADLAIIIPNLTLSACNELNRNFGAPTNTDGSPIEEGSNLVTTPLYVGTWGTSGANLIDNVSGSTEVCVNATQVDGTAAGDNYYFIYTLVSR